AARLAVDHVELVAGLERRVRADAELLGKRVHAILPGADPGAAEIDPRPVRRDVREDAAADPVAALQHDHRRARALEPERGGQPRVSGSYDAAVDGLVATGPHLVNQ